jgi:Ca2+-binding RTX toxin-like protein
VTNYNTSFIVNAADLAKILEQIKIAERHAAGENLVDIIGKDNALLPMGLRTVDGSYNHLLPGQSQVGAADEVFPRLLPPKYVNDADGDTMPLGPPGSGAPTITNTNYDPTIPGSHSVVDADPRIISNLVADQTLGNRAAVAAALDLAEVANSFEVSETIVTAYEAVNAAKANAVAKQAIEAKFETAELKAADVKAQLDIALTKLTALRAAAIDGDANDDGEAALIADAINATNAALDAQQQVVNALTGSSDPALVSALATAQSFHTTLTNFANDVSAIAAFDDDGIFDLSEFSAIIDAKDAAVLNVSTAMAIAVTLANAENTAEAVSNAADALVVTTESTLDGLVTANNLEVSTDGSLLIENRSADIGLSPANSGWMTLFGQFFDHGLDLVTKGGNGTVYIPLQADDPLIAGADKVFGTADDLPAHLRFMTLTRATPFDANGNPSPTGTESQNTTTPFVDQNQTYTSSASHQVFLREYKFSVDGPDVDQTPDSHAVNTGRLLNGINGGIANWKEVKDQAAEKLGIKLSDIDVNDVPKVEVDLYGKFLAGANGFAQVHLQVQVQNSATGKIIGTVAGSEFIREGEAGGLDIHAVAVPNPGSLPLLAPGLQYIVSPVGTGHAFLNDIAHTAAPVMINGTLRPDGNTTIGNGFNDVLNDGQGHNLQYDNELLDAHFLTGDGRGNENIGLTAVHTVFHSEHNRLVEANKATILATGDKAFINEWLITDLGAGDPIPTTPAGIAALNWDGERLFQSARFVTEMQYQHLVFEEFARRIQPNVDPFVFTNSADLDPSILAEFAHTVYRFGHSMLTDSVDRLDNNLNVVGDGDPNTAGNQQTGLIAAFLNPLMFTGSGVDDEAATGAIVRGMSRQIGNEMDEFVVEALRNNLLGLPLDLPALNIARGREQGIATLNDAREQIYAMTGAVDVKPYTSWIDFAQHMKHPISVINFIAAYGTHDTITSAMTLDAKRDAAMKLVMGGMGAPADRLDFLNATGAYAPDGTGPHNDSRGGLNNVDLWIGGLAEELNEFGGQLGSTFNYIFEYQMEHLQNGDRFYYLSRTQGMNLLNLLEPNTFSDIIMRNTDLGDLHATHLSAEIMEVPDMILELDNLAGQENYSGNAALDGTDPADRSLLDPTHDDAFLQSIDPKVVRIQGTARVGAFDADGKQIYDGGVLTFSGGEHVVLGGTEGNDTLKGDKGIDTLWGDGGNDYLNAGMESDQVFGGDGDDIIEDPFGDDFLRGEAGDDVIVADQGLDLLFGGEGQDFIMGVTDTKEVFAGPGNDFILGGTAPDGLMGNEGDDWIEGGEGFDGLSGENSELFFNSAIVGHDILDGQGNDTDYDGENGDDIMVQGAGIQRNNGMDGFDWAIHKGDANGADSDLGIRVFDARQALILRDRFDSVEGLSGWKHDDILTGANKLLLGEGFSDALTQAGVDRIAGLRTVLGDVATGAPTDVVFESDTNTGGEIILGGAGSDRIAGNLGDDILDGDAWLNVRIAVYGDKAHTGSEIFTVNNLTELVSGTGHPAWDGKSVAELMRTGVINPGQLQAVREILNSDNSHVGAAGTSNSATDVDIAVFSDNLANYTIETNGLGAIGDSDGDGLITVAHTPPGGGGGGGGNRIDDGTDKIRNFEVLQFADQRVILSGVANSAATGNLGILDGGNPGIIVGEALKVSLGTVADLNGLPLIGAFTFAWQFEATPGAGDWEAVTDPVSGNPVFGQTFIPTADHALEGLRLRVVGTFRDGGGIPEIVFSDPTDPVAPNTVTPATAGPDLIVGTLGADIINALAGDDEIFGLAGNDTITGGPGSDIIDGGAGIDTAVFDTALANALFLATPAGTLEVVIGADEDELIDIELLQFTDQTITIGDANVAAGLIRGTAAAETLTGTAADETLAGLGGNDIILAGGGDDAIIWNAGDGLDTVDGGAQAVADTLFINGIAGQAETFRIYTSAAWTALGAGHSVSPGTEIVITRNGTTDADRIILLDNVEELEINIRPITGATVARGDAVQIFGDFSTTSLALNTITINGGTGDDSVDITGLTSSHRIVFRSHGGNDTIVGNLRPQDVIELPPGSDLGSFNTTTNDDGSKTLSNGSHSIRFTGSTPHVVIEGSGVDTGNGGDDGGGSGDDDNENENENDNGGGGDDCGNDGNDDHGSHSGGGSSGNGGSSGTGGSSGSGSGGSTNTPNPSAFVVLLGSADNDTLIGSAGGDTLTGQAGDDTLLGLAGDDNIVGGAGADNLLGDAGRDIIFGNQGDDIILAGFDDDQVFGGAGNDTIFGDDGNDNIFGNEGRDVIDGGLGRDVIFITVNDGDDVISGGGGIDTLDMSAATTDAVVDLGTSGIGFAESLSSGHDTLDSIENVKGGAGDDTIYASNSVNVLSGGAGNDNFVFRAAAAANGDSIVDFQPGDQVDLRPILGTGAELLTGNEVFDMAGQFRLHVSDGDTIIEGNTDSDADVDFSIKIIGRVGLNGSDFS